MSSDDNKLDTSPEGCSSEKGDIILEIDYPRSGKTLQVTNEFSATATRRGDRKVVRLFKSCHVRFSIHDGICFITEIAGAFNGFAETAHTRTDHSGNWELVVTSGGSDIRASARALYFNH